jgi:predicted ArsR family transcriptional regulator
MSVCYTRGITVIGATVDAILHLDEIDSEMVDYMAKHGKVKAGELAELVGITIPSIRLRLFQLMAQGLVKKEKTRDHHVWFSITEKEAASCGNKMNGGGAGIPARRYRNSDNFSSGR